MAVPITQEVNGGVKCASTSRPLPKKCAGFHAAPAKVCVNQEGNAARVRNVWYTTQHSLAFCNTPRDGTVHMLAVTRGVALADCDPQSLTGQEHDPVRAHLPTCATHIHMHAHPRAHLSNHPIH